MTAGWHGPIVVLNPRTHMRSHLPIFTHTHRPPQSRWSVARRRHPPPTPSAISAPSHPFPDSPRAMIHYQANPARSFDRAWEGVPLGVLPIGFTLNTLFWGAAWAVPLLVFPALRRRGRRRRGECVRCGYSREGLAASSACPECGA